MNKDYKEDMYAEISNTAMEYIWSNTMSSISEDCQIIDDKPCECCGDFVETFKMEV